MRLLRRRAAAAQVKDHAPETGVRVLSSHRDFRQHLRRLDQIGIEAEKPQERPDRHLTGEHEQPADEVGLRRALRGCP